MWAGNLSNFSQPCPEWLKWKTTVKDIADWHMRRDQTEATRPSVTNRCLGLHASGFRRWFHSYSRSLWQPFATSLGIHFSFETSCCQMVASRTLLPFTMKANKFCGFVKWGPQGGTRMKSGLWVFVSSSPLQYTGARECEQSNLATVSRTNSLTH